MSASFPTRRSVLFGVLAFACTQTSFAQVRFSELLFNPPGVQTGQESIELRNLSNSPVNLFGFSILVFDGSAANAGVLIDSIQFPSTAVIPPNGLMLIRDTATSLVPPPAPNTAIFVNDLAVDLGGGSRTLILGFGVAVAGGTDIDLNNDGKADLNPISSVVILDAIGVVDSANPGDVGYGDDYGGTNAGPFFGPSPLPHSPDALYRIFNADGSPCAWVGGDVIGSFPGPYSLDIANDFAFGYGAEGLTSLTLDLGSPNILPDLNGNGIANACDTDVIFDGLKHQRLGGGLLTFSGPDLLVNSIGANGVDGVIAALQRSESHVIDVENAGSVLLPTGAFETFTPVGTIQGVPNQNVWSLRLEDVGSEFALTFNPLLLNPNALRIESLLGGSLVAAKNFIAPFTPGNVLATFDSARIEVTPFSVVVASSPDEFRARIRLPVTTGVDLQNGGGSLPCDEIVLRVFGAQYFVDFVSATRIVGASLGTLTIHDEAVGIFGHAHESIGTATFTPDYDKLAVEHHLLNGSDGVDIDLGVMPFGTQLGFAPIDLAASGTAVDVAFTGSVGGTAGTAVGGVSVTNTGAGIDVVADAPGLAPSQFDLRVLHDGDTIGSITVPYSGSATVASVAAAAGGRELRWVGLTVGAAPELVVRFAEPVTITPSGGSAWVGDELRIAALGAPQALDFVSRATVNGASVDSITLDCESGFNITSYGTGCAGTGGFVPRLRIDGCAQVDQQVRVRVDRCLGGTVGLILFGATPSATPIGFAPGCTLNVFPIFSLLPVFLSGGGPGDGAITFTGTVPYYGAGLSLPMQVANFDAGANLLGVSMSNGLLIRFDP